MKIFQAELLNISNGRRCTISWVAETRHEARKQVLESYGGTPWALASLACSFGKEV